MPEFSIIMPCFNAAETLNETIGSLLSQTVPDWELICIDDGSTDETPDMLAGWAEMDKRIRMVTNVGSGPSAARNYGAELAVSATLCFCDADDLWDTDKLACVRRAFEYQSTDAVFGRVAFFHKRGKVDTFSTVPNDPLTIDGLLGENPVCTLSNLSVRRAVFLFNGGFNPSFIHNEDLEWMVRAIGQGAVIHGHREHHVWYRCSLQGLSSDLTAMQRSRARVLQQARSFGVTPNRRAEAVYLRYLARRALRVKRLSVTPLRLTCAGLWQNPVAFLFPLHRGGATLLAALLAALCAPLFPITRHWHFS